MLAILSNFCSEVWYKSSAKNTLYLGAFSLILALVFQDLVGLSYSGESIKNQPTSYDYAATFKTGLAIVIVAPLLETLINQVAVINLLRTLKFGDRLAVGISAILFAYMHFWMTEPSVDVLIQMIPIIPTGLLLGLVYLRDEARNGWIEGFKFTFAVHASHNGYIFLLICAFTYIDS